MAALALNTTFPQPIASDHDDVRCALTVATASWRRGNVADALTWLRRASKAAADADDVLRAMELSKAASEIAPANEPPTIDESGERPSRSAPARRSSGPPPRRSGFAPKRASRAASRPGPPPRPSSSAPQDAPPPRPSRPGTSHPAVAPPPLPSAAPTQPRARHTTDLEQTRRRMPACSPVIPPPPKSVDPASLGEDDEDVPTIIMRSAAPEPAPSQPIALVPADDAGASWNELSVTRDEDTVRDRRRLHPPVRGDDDEGIPLSAARVAVVPSTSGGRPDIHFLPFGAHAPEGAVTAMLVTTNARDAAKLAELMTAATR